jgi:mannose-6-phosphate isomerase-like protein (cupin superfamily)
MSHSINEPTAGPSTVPDWQPVRPQLTRGVFGKTILDGDVKVVLTRVEPGGKFATHRDDYGHVFYFLSGKGVVTVADSQMQARPDLFLRVTAGELHSYENTGSQDLVLISLNIPQAKA